ncbi:MAG: cytochrome c [Pirellulales bacterium]|nr:cytochrome c [Pirellulales bacterium]
MTTSEISTTSAARARHISRSVLFFLCSFAFLSAVGLSSSALQDEPLVSQFAPADDLLTMVNKYIEEAGAIVESAEEFGKSDRRTHLGELAESVQVLALALCRHDKLPEGTNASSFVIAYRAAGELYAAADQPTAVKALEEVKRGLAGGVEQSQELPKWGKTDQMYDLMTQVQNSQGAINRGMRRLARRPAPIQENAAFLAAVGHETLFAVPQDLPQELQQPWREYSIAMRDSAAALNAAARAKDEAAAKAAVEALTKSCDDCHAQIRDRAPLIRVGQTR